MRALAPTAAIVISSLDVVKYLGAAVVHAVGIRDVAVSGVASLSAATARELAFCSVSGPAATQALSDTGAGVVLCRADVVAGYATRADLMCLGVENPRLEFVRVYERFFSVDREYSIHPTAAVGRGCAIAESVAIGPYAVIGNGVTIGEGSRIGPGVFVGDGTMIGAQCDVHANAVIGEAGFGFERDSTGRAVPFPHLGRVVIGNRVLIGAHTCIARGALSDTIVEDDVQIDSHVHVAHHVHIHRSATIVAHSSISGGAEIEEGAWLSSGSLITGRTTVGAGAKVGVGSVVTSPVRRRVTVFGNPARTIWAGK